MSTTVLTVYDARVATDSEEESLEETVTKERRKTCTFDLVMTMQTPC